jgi:thymidylate kinase
LSSLIIVTDLDPELDEGMAVTARSLVSAARALGWQVKLFSPPKGASEFRARTYVAWAAWQLRAMPPASLILYIPRGGLTRPSVAKGVLLARIGRGRIAQLILQSGAEPIPWVSRRVVYLVLSEFAAQNIKRAGGMSATVHLGVDDSKFAPVGPADASMWPRGDGARVLHVGHLRQERNVGVLADLSRKGFSCLLVASPATSPDKALGRELADAGVAVVRRHIGDLAAVYRAADVYLFPVSDPRACTTMPLSVLEALACGTQVVSVPFGAVGEVFSDTPAVQLSSPEQLISAVERAVKSPHSVDDALVPSWATSVMEMAQAASTDRKGKLVLLLGLDGTGKSTQSRLLVEEARERGLLADSIWARWDPLLLSPLLRLRRIGVGGSGEIGSADYLSWKRRLFRSGIARAAWRRAAAADHFLRVGMRLRRTLRMNDFVVCDRYYHDALVDMAVGFGGEPPAPVGMHRLFPKADVTLLLDAPEDVLLSRKVDVPSREYLAVRRPLYLELAARNGWPVIDALQPAADVHQALSKHVWGNQ